MKKVKTRQEIAEEYGISRRTFQRWLKKQKIALPNGLITPKEQEMIYNNFGYPQTAKQPQFAFNRA
jgi:DNA invertase Pin-like site-specific DNA recombinase